MNAAPVIGEPSAFQHLVHWSSDLVANLESILVDPRDIPCVTSQAGTIERTSIYRLIAYNDRVFCAHIWHRVQARKVVIRVARHLGSMGKEKGLQVYRASLSSRYSSSLSC